MSSARKNRLYHKLQSAAHRVHKVADHEVKAASRLTSAQGSVLSIVGTMPGLSQRELSRQLGLNESAVTAMVSRMMRAGLLERARDESDKRAWTLHLTPSGEEAVSHIQAPFEEINSRIEAALSDTEIVQLSSLLRKLAKRFEGL